jgi:hypothetical protein
MSAVAASAFSRIGQVAPDHALESVIGLGVSVVAMGACSFMFSRALTHK